MVGCGSYHSFKVYRHSRTVDFLIRKFDRRYGFTVVDFKDRTFARLSAAEVYAVAAGCNKRERYRSVARDARRIEFYRNPIVYSAVNCGFGIGYGVTAHFFPCFRSVAICDVPLGKRSVIYVNLKFIACRHTAERYVQSHSYGSYRLR